MPGSGSLLERIAGGHFARFQAAAEPARSLGGRTVRERLGTDPAGRHSLQAVVTYGGSRAKTGCDVGLVDDLSFFSRVAPYTRQTVSLQFETHRQRVLR